VSTGRLLGAKRVVKSLSTWSSTTTLGARARIIAAEHGHRCSPPGALPAAPALTRPHP